MRGSRFQFIVQGCGSIGQRHIANLLALKAGPVAAVEAEAGRRAETVRRFGIPVHDRLEKAVPRRGAVAALICTPTRHHLAHALAAARLGCHLFIEKPLSDGTAGVDRLLREVRTRKLKTLVGCNFRFHPGLRFIHELLRRGRLGRVVSAAARFGQYLPDWRPRQDYRKSYSARRRLGGGVILDRIHEIDYLRWLFGPVRRVQAAAGHVSPLQIDTEDVAEMILHFKAGFFGTVHLDYLRRAYDCSLEVIGTEGVARWTFQEHAVDWYRPSLGRWVRRRWPGEDVNGMYREELRHFLRVLAGRERAEQDLRQAAEALAVASAAKRSAASGRAVAL